MLQLAALDMLMKVDPAVHVGHTVLAVALQLTLRYVPGQQTEQLVRADEPL